jgi:hypothetical protein
MYGRPNGNPVSSTTKKSASSWLITSSVPTIILLDWAAQLGHSRNVPPKGLGLLRGYLKISTFSALGNFIFDGGYQVD